MDDKTTRDRHMTISVQYYLAARWATFGGLIPIAANLFHHAIEMLLKKVIKEKLGHNLPAIWEKFKEMYPKADLSLYDERKTIERLHQWEEIRYPDNNEDINESMKINDGWIIYYDRPSGVHKEYSLTLYEIDELYKAIWFTIGIHPLYLDGEISTSKEKKEIYERENSHIIYKGYQISDILNKQKNKT